MDQDRIEGPIKEGAGKAKEEWGDVTDDASTEAEGKKDQVEGNIQNKWGEAKDAFGGGDADRERDTPL